MLAPAPQNAGTLEPENPSTQNLGSLGTQEPAGPVPATGVRYWFFTCK